MSINFKEKMQDFLELLLTVVLDLSLVVIIALLTYIAKWAIEKIYGQKIEMIDNVALYYVYTISKYLLISITFIYAVYDISQMIKKLFSRLK